MIGSSIGLLLSTFLVTLAMAAGPAGQVNPKDMKDVPDPATVSADPRAQMVQSVSDDTTDEPQNIGLILDSSGSMGQILEKNKTKMFFLKKLMKDFVRQQWKLKNSVDVRVYGSRAKHRCDDIIDAIPYSDHGLGTLEKSLEKMEPLGMTPLHRSIEMTVKEIQKRPGPKKIVIVTDGDDTCGGDPCKTAEKIKKDKLDITFFVIALGSKGESDELKKLSCLGDVHAGNDSQSFSDAVSQVSSKIKNGGGTNLKVNSPNPDAVVYLYATVNGKRKLDRAFYANSPQRVDPGNYEVIVGLNPPYKFDNVTIPPHRKVTLTVQGEGEIKVNFFGGHIKAQLLDKNNKVVVKFKSDAPTKAPIGKWKLRMYREPFYENILTEFYVYPNGHHVVDLNGVGVVRVDAPTLEGVYVYDQDHALIDHTLTQIPFVLKTGVYSVHINDKCSFPKVEIHDKKEVLVLDCKN